MSEAGEWWVIAFPENASYGNCTIDAQIKVNPSDMLEANVSLLKGKDCMFLGGQASVRTTGDPRQPEYCRLSDRTLITSNWQYNISSQVASYLAEGIMTLNFSSIDFVFTLTYIHENSYFGGLTHYCSIYKCIKVSNSFQRNVYNDLVEIYGQEFLDRYSSQSIVFVGATVLNQCMDITEYDPDTFYNIECQLLSDYIRISNLLF